MSSRVGLKYLNSRGLNIFEDVQRVMREASPPDQPSATLLQLHECRNVTLSVVTAEEVRHYVPLGWQQVPEPPYHTGYDECSWVRTGEIAVSLYPKMFTAGFRRLIDRLLALTDLERELVRESLPLNQGRIRSASLRTEQHFSGWVLLAPIPAGEVGEATLVGSEGSPAGMSWRLSRPAPQPARQLSPRDAAICSLVRDGLLQACEDGDGFRLSRNASCLLDLLPEMFPRLLIAEQPRR